MRRRDFQRVYNAVITVLANYPNGITLRTLAHKSKIPASTLRWYLDRDLAFYVRDQRIPNVAKPFARLITLRPSAASDDARRLQKILEDHS